MPVYESYFVPVPKGTGREWLFSAISVPACRQTGQAQILILKIRGCIPAVKIFAFLDPAKNFSFPDSLLRHFSQYSSLTSHYPYAHSKIYTIIY